MNGANAVLGIQLKDSRRQKHKGRLFSLQTRLLNKAGGMGWGCPLQRSEEGIKAPLGKKY